MASKLSYPDLCGSIYTKEDADAFLSKLDELLGAAFNTKEGARKRLAKLFPYQKKEEIINWCQKNAIDLRDPNQVEKFVGSLREVVEAMPRVILNIGFEPGEAAIKKISNWFVLQLGRKYLLDINCQRELIGGAAVGCGGKYRDYSLKKYLETKYG